MYRLLNVPRQGVAGTEVHRVLIYGLKRHVAGLKGREGGQHGVEAMTTTTTMMMI